MKRIPFKCLKCGRCCRAVVGRNFGAALTGEEKNRLLALAERHGVELEIKPLATNGMWVTVWQMATNPCPFLKNNECMIYPYRPLFCKMFPLHPYGVSECTFLDRYGKMGDLIAYPQEMQKAALDYYQKITLPLRSATKRYNLNTGRWESPNPSYKKFVTVEI